MVCFTTAKRHEEVFPPELSSVFSTVTVCRVVGPVGGRNAQYFGEGFSGYCSLQPFLGGVVVPRCVLVLQTDVVPPVFPDVGTAVQGGTCPSGFGLGEGNLGPVWPAASRCTHASNAKMKEPELSVLPSFSHTTRLCFFQRHGELLGRLKWPFRIVLRNTSACVQHPGAPFWSCCIAEVGVAEV